ncbi:MAG: cadherin-like beta sandwich domain-containing protein, partial [Verrucomicrobiota bacterium]
NYPKGVSVEPAGNVYVADASNHRIRKITSAGVVTTLAGSTSGALDGTGIAAQFNNPAGVAVDAVGNVYVADGYNHRIRKISPSAEVSTLAGSTIGSADGTGVGAQFDSPWALAVDNAGNLYVGESAGSRLRKVTAEGVVTTLAGYFNGYRDGVGTSALFYNVMGVALDSAGNVYLGDRQNNRVRKVVLTRPALVLAQSGVTGVAAQPASLTLSNLIPGTTYYYWAQGGNVAGTNTGTMLSFTTLSTNALIRNLTLSAGTLSPVFASNTVSYATIVSNAVSSLTVTATAAQGNAVLKVNGTTVTSGVASSAISLEVGTNTLAVAVTAQDGVTTNLYTLSVWRQPLPPTVTTVAATLVTSSGAVLTAGVNPNGAGSDVGFAYSRDPNLLEVTTLAGSTNSGYANGTGAAARFDWPQGVALDAAGNTYVADQNNHSIRKITPGGVVTAFAGSTTGGYLDGVGTAAQFKYARGVAVDGAGNVYVADGNNHRIRKITSAGVVTTLAGGAGASDGRGYLDARGTNAMFTFPSNVAIDSGTNVYVVEYVNRIRKITPAGDVTTLAGSGVAGYADGNGTNASFNNAFGLVVDAGGNVYVGDGGNNCIRKITPTGDVSTMAGSEAHSGYLDGTGAAARFSDPYGLAMDAATNLLVVDLSNNRVRKVTPAGVVTTVAGSTQGAADGPAYLAQFYWPASVAVDSEGTLYVGDYYNNSIRKIGLQRGSLSQSGLAGLSLLSVTNVIVGLLPETTYYYRATGTNLMGMGAGALLSFTTLSTNASLSGLALSQGALT